MDKFIVPLAKPAPDAKAFIRAVTTPWEPPRPRMVEYLVNEPIRKAIMENLMGRKWAQLDGTAEGAKGYWDNFIEFWYRMGYDFVRMEIEMAFPHPDRPGGDHNRAYAETSHGPIGTWEQFEKYPWPDPATADFSAYEYVSSHLPEGMGLIVCHAANVLEHMEYLMGYETLCISLFDQPDLVEAVSRRVGELLLTYYRRLLELPNLIAIFPGDDMGFRSGTLISPDDLRKYVLPWHKKYAELTHARRLPYFLHSCGQLGQIMDDLIDDVKIDAKHSYEDAIIPVWDFKKKYGQRVGILGGVDLDRLTRLSPPDLRKHVRRIITDCQPGGRFAVGSGNSVPDYVPVENYLTMLDEILR